MAPSTNDLFRALADPTRRRILDLLAEHGTLTVSRLAEEFPDLVASGISKHLMGLRAEGLVTATRQGRQRLYRIDADALAAVLAPWLAKYESRTGPRRLSGCATSQKGESHPIEKG